MANNVTEAKFALDIGLRLRRTSGGANPGWTMAGRATTLDASGNEIRQVTRDNLEDLLTNAEKIALRDALNAAVARFATLRGVDPI
jgi:hypothetical protein